MLFAGEPAAPGSRPSESTPLAAKPRAAGHPGHGQQASELDAERELPRDAAALNVFRLVGAIHITAFHQITRDSCTVCHWGAAWVSFFFMLSGFGSTHSRLSKTPISELSAGPLLPRAATLFRRWVGVWPAYAVAFGGLLCFYLRAEVQRAPSPVPPLSGPLLTIELSMVQEWLPTGTWRHLLPLANQTRTSYAELVFNEINVEDWYVSVLAFLWLVENALFELFAIAARHGSRTAFPCNGLGAAFVGLVAWVVLSPYVGFPPLRGFNRLQ